MASSESTESNKPLVGVLAIQGAFEEHQACLEASGCRTKQVRQQMCLKDSYYCAVVAETAVCFEIACGQSLLRNALDAIQNFLIYICV